MLDGPHTSGGRLANVDGGREVARERRTEPLRLRRHREEDGWRKVDLLDEVGALHVLAVYFGHGRRRVCGVGSGQDRAGHGEDGGGRGRRQQPPFPPAPEELRRAGHLAHARDALRQHELEAPRRIKAVQRVGVHVHQPRRDIGPVQIDPPRAGLAGARERRDRGYAAMLDHDIDVAADGAGAYVYDVGVRQH